MIGIELARQLKRGDKLVSLMTGEQWSVMGKVKEVTNGLALDNVHLPVMKGHEKVNLARYDLHYYDVKDDYALRAHGIKTALEDCRELNHRMLKPVLLSDHTTIKCKVCGREVTISTQRNPISEISGLGLSGEILIDECESDEE